MIFNLLTGTARPQQKPSNIYISLFQKHTNMNSFKTFLGMLLGMSYLIFTYLKLLCELLLSSLCKKKSFDPDLVEKYGRDVLEQYPEVFEEWGDKVILTDDYAPSYAPWMINPKIDKIKSEPSQFDHPCNLVKKGRPTSRSRKVDYDITEEFSSDLIERYGREVIEEFRNVFKKYGDEVIITNDLSTACAPWVIYHETLSIRTPFCKKRS